jgi:hypothetical protein
MEVSAWSPLLVSASGVGSTAQLNSINIQAVAIPTCVSAMTTGLGQVLSPSLRRHWAKGSKVRKCSKGNTSSLARQHQTLQHALHVQQQQQQHEAGVQVQ